MVAWGLQGIIKRWPHRKMFSVLVVMTALATFMIVARIQVGYWSNNLILYEHTLKTTTGSFAVHRNYGLALAHKGRLDEAMHHFQLALQIDPNYARTYHDVGTVLMLKGDYDESLKYLRYALKLRPNFKTSHNNLGLVLLSQGRAAEAASHFRKALQIDPGFKQARKNLKQALADAGR